MKNLAEEDMWINLHRGFLGDLFFHRGATGRGGLTGCVIFLFFFENFKMSQLNTLKIFTFSMIMKKEKDRHFPPRV